STPSEMNPLISSGDAKITSARSPIMPAGTRAGALFCGPSSLTSVLKRKLRSQKSRILSVCGSDLVGIAAMIDRLHAIFRVELLEVGRRAAGHHPTHLIAALRGLGRAAGLRRVLEKGEQIGTLPRVGAYRRSRCCLMT